MASPDAWYYSFVEMAAEKGLLPAPGTVTLPPEASMTYAGSHRAQPVFWRASPPVTGRGMVRFYLCAVGPSPSSLRA